MSWQRMYGENRYVWKDWSIEKRSHWPFAPWDIFHRKLQSDGMTWRSERFAGGFFTRRAAQRWAEKEQKLYDWFEC